MVLETGAGAGRGAGLQVGADGPEGARLPQFRFLGALFRLRPSGAGALGASAVFLPESRPRASSTDAGTVRTKLDRGLGGRGKPAFPLGPRPLPALAAEGADPSPEPAGKTHPRHGRDAFPAWLPRRGGAQCLPVHPPSRQPLRASSYLPGQRRDPPRAGRAAGGPHPLWGPEAGAQAHISPTPIARFPSAQAPHGSLAPPCRKLFVSLAVLECLATTGFTAFFLFPRSIAVRPVGLSSSSVAFDKGTVHLKATMLYAMATRISDETT